MQDEASPDRDDKPDGMMDYYQRKYGWSQRVVRSLLPIGLITLLVGTLIGYGFTQSLFSPYTWIPLAVGCLLIVAGEVLHVASRR